MGAGTEHSCWALWTTWRRGPDHLAHIVDSVAEALADPDSKVEAEVQVRGDLERFAPGDNPTDRLTHEALKSFRAIVINGGEDALRVRIAFVRRPSVIEVGTNHPIRVRLRQGVVLETMSTESSGGVKAQQAFARIAPAVDRGRPRRVTRQAVHGRSLRQAPLPGRPPDTGASASRLLGEALVSWPPPSMFVPIFIVLCLALYSGVIGLFNLHVLELQNSTVDLHDAGTRTAVISGAVVVAIVAAFAQAWLFPAIEVASLTNSRRLIRFALSSVTISGVIGGLVKVGPLGTLFS